MQVGTPIVHPGEGASQTFQPGKRFTWKIGGTDSDGTLDFGELSLEPDVGVPEHIHHRHNEAFYILDGTYRFKVGGELAEASSGTFVFIPRGVPHAWRNIGGGPGRVIVLFTPGGMTGFFRELAPLLPELRAGLPDMSKVNPEVLGRATDIMQRYHYEQVGPPLA